MRSVHAEIHVPCSSERAIRAFLDPADLAGWWGVERSLVEPEIGGLFAVAWGVTPAGFGYVTTGVIGAIEHGSLLRIDRYTYFHPERPILGPMALVVRASASGSGALLSVDQTGYRDGPDWDWYYEAVRSAWPEVVSRIAGYLATRA
jgi:hypothetical protein